MTVPVTTSVSTPRPARRAGRSEEPGILPPRGLLDGQVVARRGDRGVHAATRGGPSPPGARARSATSSPKNSRSFALGSRVTGDHPRDHASCLRRADGQRVDARHDPADVRRLPHEEGHQVDHHDCGASRVEVLEGVPPTAPGLVPGVLPLLDEPGVVGRCPAGPRATVSASGEATSLHGHRGRADAGSARRRPWGD